MKTKVFVAVLALSSLLLIGCDSDSYQEYQDAQAKTLIEGHEEELTEAINKANNKVVEQEPVAEPEPVVEPELEPEPVVEPELEPEPTESPEVALAKCLTASGATLYTATWCGHCQGQKDAFGEGLEYLNHVDCAAFGGWSQDCKDAGVEAVPTWIFGDGTTQLGNTPLAKIAELSGCTY